MKKILYGALVVTILIIGIVGNFMLNYHSTPEGAMDELNKQTEGLILPLSDNTEALLIEEDGTVSVASSKIVHPLGWYKDFDLSKTDLNVYETDLEKEIPYTHAPKTEGLSFGLIKNEQIESSLVGIELRKQSATNVFHLEDHLENQRLTNVKLWYSFVLGEGDTFDDVFFLDKNKEVVQLEQEFVSQNKK